MSRLRLLAIIEAHTITGPAKNLLEFAELARPNGVETTIATFTRGAASSLFIDTVRARGIPIETISEQGAFDLRAARTLRSLAERLKPDVIQTHAVKSHFLARLGGLPHQTPWVAFHHGYTWPTLKARLYNQIDRWSLPAARQVLTVSGPFREELIAHGVKAERIQIVHNAIPGNWGQPFREPEAAQRLRQQLGIGAENKVILIVGRLSQEKDHRTLLEAVASLSSELSPKPRPHLLIVGDGPERARIEERVAQLNLTTSVTLTGQLDSAAPYYGIADVAVLSSLSEGSPNALLEAMAVGVPIVATKVGGIPEIVRDEESALLVPPGDIPAMRSALARVLGDAALTQRLVSRAAEQIERNHSPEARMKALVDIYTSLLRPGTGRG